GNMPSMDELHQEMAKLMAAHNEMMGAHRENQDHLIRMMERQADLESVSQDLKTTEQRMTERKIDLEDLTKQVAENNIRLGRILGVHDYDIDELDARLRRLEERNRGGRA